MTDGGRADRRLKVELSVVAASALVLAGSYALVASVDRERVAERERAGRLGAPDGPPDAWAPAPAPGLVPASPPRRRTVVVRRSRPS